MTASKNPRPRIKSRVGRPPSNDLINAPADQDRRGVILDAAIRRFAETGFDGTSMRDIAASTGILTGSLYYHFKSKEELFCAVHEESIRVISANVVAAIDPGANPWTRLEQAASAYLQSLADHSAFVSIVIGETHRRRPAPLGERLIQHRDSFEKHFTEIVESLPLVTDVDRNIWRLALLGMLAWTYVWFDPNARIPADEMGRRLVAMLREKTSA